MGDRSGAGILAGALMSMALIIAGILIASLSFYALLAGADYGGGVWDLFSGGPRETRQRELIAHAIGPMWEANHVWLILVVVVLFTAFPPAFARIAIGLHVPIVLLLIGIVLRGSAFTFRSYAPGDKSAKMWGHAFAMASLFTPVLLGIIVGAISSGVAAGVRTDGRPAGMQMFFEWVAPFPFAVGLFALALFAFLAAVYLTVEAEEPALQEDFRVRAISAELVAGILALVVFLLAERGAPEIRERLSTSWWTWPLQITTAGLAIGALTALVQRRYRWARGFAIAQVALILWGWALAQFPYLVWPDVTIQGAAAPEPTLRFLMWALGAGALLLFPSLWYLFRVFKREGEAR